MGDLYPAEKLKFHLSGEVITALIIVAVIFLFSIYVFIRAKTANPLKRPKGILLLMEIAVSKIDDFVKDTMGKGFENYQ